MGFIKRINDILNANVHAFLDKHEDAENMLNQFIRDLNGEMQKYADDITKAYRDEARLREDCELVKKEIAKLQNGAAKALCAEDETLAADAIEKKQSLEISLIGLETELSKQSATVKDLREDYSILKKKLTEFESERDELIRRNHRANAKSKMGNTALRGSDIQDKFSRMRNKVLESEARVAFNQDMAGEDIDSRLANLDKIARQQSVKDELEALKASLAKDKK